MPSASALRLEIERTLEHRFPAALTPAPKTIYEVAPIGVAPVDALLEGGLPVGAISEVTGPESSGRTSLTLAFLAKRTEGGQVCAWVDAGDAFDPESAAAICVLVWPATALVPRRRTTSCRAFRPSPCMDSLSLTQLASR